MKTPHKHAALIHAWADGAEIQWESEGIWQNITHPRWNRDKGYRAKPAPLRYRNYLLKPMEGRSASILAVTEEQNGINPREDWNFFHRWLGDWQEVEEAAPRNKYPDLSTEGEN